MFYNQSMQKPQGKYLVIDVREPSEYESSHVDGALNIPPEQFMTGEIPAKLRQTQKDTPLILYCRSGQRSNTCLQILKGFGFTDITNGVNELRVRQLLGN